MTIPGDFFTIGSFATLAGCTAIVYIVTGVIGYLMNFKTSQTVKKWLSIGLSMAVAFVAASLSEDKTAYTWILAVFNGFLIFVAATGTNAIFASKETMETAESTEKAAAAASSNPKTSSAKQTYSTIADRKGKFSDKWW
jgi:Ca2+/Na+ antiporter